MAGGASSRMKKSIKESDLPTEVLAAAQHLHKSLIPLGNSGRPLLYYLLKNAVAAGIKTVYLTTSEDNLAFKTFIDSLGAESDLKNLQVKLAVQYLPGDRERPLGTADALQQCLEQHQNLMHESFTVCNGDNLYDMEALKALRKKRETPHALIAYDGQSLGHPKEKIAKFALIDFDMENRLVDILEKPSEYELEEYQKKHRRLWVSMNIFNLHGASVFPFLLNCRLHPVRKEKELPTAIGNLINESPGSVLCIPRSTRIPDLTFASDISTFFKK